MISLDEVKRKRAALAEALEQTEVALNHDEYSKPFVFTYTNKVDKSNFKSDTLISIHNKCIERNIGFDPDLLCQHIEREALEQFNQIATEKIKGKSIRELMTMRHELELFMLVDRNKHYKEQLGKMDEILLEAVTGVSPNPTEEVVVAEPSESRKVDSKKKKK